jgi:F0F1-type ATP synthase membrane subunit b/b'
MEKQKQAQRERDSYQMEIANLSSFEDKVMKETIGNTVKFKESYKKEIDEKIARVQKESEAKIRNTKASGEDQVKQQLIDAVIADTKSSMNSDAQLKAKVTTNLLNNI